MTRAAQADRGRGIRRARPVQGVATEPLYLDMRLQPECRDRSSRSPHEHDAFAYVYSGEARLGGPDSEPNTRLSSGQLGVLSAARDRAESRRGGRMS